MSLDVIVHLQRGAEDAALREMARVLEPGGLLVIRTSALDILRSRHTEFAGERQRFTRGRLEARGGAARHQGAALHLRKFVADACRAGAISALGAAHTTARGKRRGTGSALARPPSLRPSGCGGALVGRRIQPARWAIHRSDRGEAGGPVTNKFPSLSVFFPAYNDAPSLARLLAKTFAVLERHVEDYEVIVVNDGSQDDTAKVLAASAATYGGKLRVVTHPRNLGYGMALRSGMEAARKEFIFYTDGDGQYDVDELPKLLTRMAPGVGLVNGYKLERHDPLHRVWIGKFYNFCARLLFRIRIRDIDCDYRLMRRSLVEKMRLESTSGTICVELVRKFELSGCEVVEVGVRHYPRLHGRSQFFRVKSLMVTLGQLLRLWWELIVRRAG